MILESVFVILVCGWIISAVKLVFSINWIKKRQTEYLIVFLLHENGFIEKKFDEFFYSLPDYIYWNIGFLLGCAIVRILIYVF